MSPSQQYSPWPSYINGKLVSYLSPLNITYPSQYLSFPMVFTYHKILRFILLGLLWPISLGRCIHMRIGILVCFIHWFFPPKWLKQCLACSGSLENIWQIKEIHEPGRTLLSASPYDPHLRFFTIWATKESACNVGDLGSILGSGRSPGEGNGTPQYSCLENSMDRGAWWATVHVVTKSWTQLSD